MLRLYKYEPTSKLKDNIICIDETYFKINTWTLYLVIK